MLMFHTSDWHLGRMLYGRSLLEDQRYFLDQCFLPAVRRLRPACVLLSGDIYDRQVAPAQAIRLFDGVLDQLVSLGCKVFAISGNHDGGDRIAIMKSALRRSGVYLATTLEEALEPVIVEEGGESAQIFLLPYFDCAQARDFLGEENLRGESACMEALLARLTPKFLPGAAHILVSHCFAAGAAISESESIFVGGSGQVSPSLFAPFDYAALGHLHGPQKAGETARYSGSPLKYSLSEAGQKKCFLRLEVHPGSVTAEPEPVSPLRDVKEISGSFSQLLAAGEEALCEDYAELRLTDQNPVLLAASRLLPYYPNLLGISHSWGLASGAGERAARLKGQNSRDIFAAFLQDVCGQEADEADLALFEEILKEVEA